MRRRSRDIPQHRPAATGHTGQRGSLRGRAHGSLTMALAVLLAMSACTAETPARPADPPAAGLDAGKGVTAPSPGSPSPSPRTSTAGTDRSGTMTECRGRTESSAATVTSPTTASYLGTGSGDVTSGIDIGAGCTIVVGGRLTGSSVLTGAAKLPRGGAGVVVRLSDDGRRVLSAVRVAGTVDDLEVRRTTGDIAVATDRGVRVLDASAATIRWQTREAVRRVAIGDAGTVAALTGTTVRIHDATGKRTGSVRLAGSTVEDVAVDDRTGLVFVAGFTQRGGPCRQVQVPFVRAYRHDGTARWRLYDYDPDELDGLCADSRVNRVAMGRDGELYLAGEMAGGTSVFTSNGRSARTAAPNVAYDKFTTTSNTSDAHLTYFARLNPATGTVKAGQTLLARIDVKGDKGNTITPAAITADADGRVYVGGSSAYQIAGRSRLRMNGRTLQPYAGGDAWVLVTSPDLRKRLQWTAWTDGGQAEVTGLAVQGSLVTLAARVVGPSMYITAPVQRAVPAAGSGYFAVWPARR
ncbi:hypothetical protein AB0G04_18765 [Actinoplanes sp. NPDC023801]|uniref:hypothetical protein n=1 Tax=Actinoplanes sp. NPDC023801 TaxID=3154595 RepID=UPI0033D2FDDC